MSRFVVRDGLIAEYRESVNGGVAMAQLGVEPERMTKVFKRWAGWLQERPETSTIWHGQKVHAPKPLAQHNKRITGWAPGRKYGEIRHDQSASSL